MKKIIVGVVLLGSITAVAASLNTNKKKDKAITEKKTEKKEKECRNRKAGIILGSFFHPSKFETLCPI